MRAGIDKHFYIAYDYFVKDNPVLFVILAVVYILLFIFYIATYWKIFSKAGKPGWTSIIPIYNIIVLFDIVGRPVWWIILFFIPVINIVVSIILSLDLAKVFGKSSLFGIVGLVLFPFIGYPMLAFGRSTYTGKETPAQTPATNGQNTPPAPVPSNQPPPAI